MDKYDPTKVFDVSKPSSAAPSQTSRPVITGHTPLMQDPMMRPAPQHQVGPSFPQPAQQAPAAPAIQAVAPGLPPTQAPAVPEMPQHHDKIVAASEAAHRNIQAQNGPGAYGSQPPQPQPTEPMSLPTTAPFMPAPPGAEATYNQVPMPAPVPNHQAHFESIPVGHVPMSSSHRLEMVMAWLLVIVFLLGFAAYLAIDAGFVATNINLPFHIFSRS